MFQKLFTALCLCAFLALATGCIPDKTPVAQDHTNKNPTENSDTDATPISGVKGDKNGTVKLEGK